MYINFLAAGKPLNSNKPILLNHINSNLKILDWQIRNLNSQFKDIKINIITGYGHKLYSKSQKYKNVNIIYNKNWLQGIHTTISKINFETKNTFIQYADTIFEPSVYKSILNENDDVVVCVDSNWERRYPQRPKKDIAIAEKIKIKNKIYEYTGLIFFNDNNLRHINNIHQIKIDNHYEILNYIKSKNLSIKYLDIKSSWAELNLEKDIAKFFIKSKSKTLEKLASSNIDINIPEQFSFSYGKFLKDKNLIYSNIKNLISSKKIIIRSNSFNEDTWASSNAGKFLSIPNIKKDDKKLVLDSISKVFRSYGKINSYKDEVLIQEYLKKINKVGVVLTCSLSKGSDYYQIDYDIDKSITDGVTSGKSKYIKSIKIVKNKTQLLKKNEIDIYKLISKIKKFENLLVYDKLDIEYLIDNSNKIYILQLRPITVNYNNKFYDKELFYKKLYLAKKKLGNKAMLSNMSDWNPAEIIGVHPKILAFDLYNILITDNIWAIQRYQIGFEDLRKKRLLKNLLGRPFVKLEFTLKSFIPKNLPQTTKRKLLNFYKDLIIKNPHDHDKIEFKVCYSYWYPDLTKDLNSLKKNYGFTDMEIINIDNSIKEITINTINKVFEFKDLELLKENRKKILNSKISNIQKIKKIISNCKKNGTLYFAHHARCCFVVISILKYLLNKSLISKNSYHNFLKSISSINKLLLFDRKKYFNNEIKLKSLKKIYGHLREGTYEISNFSYRENHKKYLEKKNILIDTDINFDFKNNEKINISKFFKELGLDKEIKEIISFMRKSIELRELTKFEFTKDIDIVFKLILSEKKLSFLKREQLSYLKIEDIQFYLSNKISKKDLIEILEKRISNYEFEKIYDLPDIILNPNDLFYYVSLNNIPNFITLKNVKGEAILLNKNKKTDLNNKIIIIEQADPGYDWIFAYKIKGLITKYGGANSHMSIRSAELDIPAAIGIGSMIYSQIIQSNYLHLNCIDKFIRVLN